MNCQWFLTLMIEIPLILIITQPLPRSAPSTSGSLSFHRIDLILLVTSMGIVTAFPRDEIYLVLIGKLNTPSQFNPRPKNAVRWALDQQPEKVRRFLARARDLNILEAWPV